MKLTNEKIEAVIDAYKERIPNDCKVRHCIQNGIVDGTLQKTGFKIVFEVEGTILSLDEATIKYNLPEYEKLLLQVL